MPRRDPEPEGPRRAPADAPLAVIRRTAPAANRSARVLKFEASRPKPPGPLMGRTGSQDTQGQMRLTFPTIEATRRFADDQGWRYIVRKPRRRKPVVKSYDVRFAQDRRVA